jgi:hypothetical protein
LEELQQGLEALDEMADEDTGLSMSEWRMIKDFVSTTNKFINDLIEQEMRK